jgi:hypothetical protein
MEKLSFNKEWVKSVSFTDFKKNSIIALLEPKRQHDLYEELTGKKIKFKGEAE